MSDYNELKRLAEAAPEGPWFGPEYAPGTSYVFDVDLGSLLHYESIDTEQDACLRYVAAANPAAVLALIAENERLAKQWGDRPAYRTPEYESKRDAMWRRAHMVATSKGYDHISMAIAAAPTACVDCMGCGGEWQGDGIPNAVCEVCNGSRGKTLEQERDQLKSENERQAAQFKEWQASHHANYCNAADERDRLKAENEAIRENADKWQIVERAMEQLKADERGGSIWSVCARLLISVAHKLNSAVSTVTEEGVTIGDQEIGDWRVTVERVNMSKELND